MNTSLQIKNTESPASGQNVPLSRRLLLGLALLFALQFSGAALAQSTFSEAQTAPDHFFMVQLDGGTEYGTVQLFSYLLTQIDAEALIRPLRMRIDAEDPAQCRVDWRVRSTEFDAVAFSAQLRQLINDLPLDTDVHGFVAYDTPFSVSRESMQQVKRAEPLVMSQEKTVFVIGSLPDQKEKGKKKQSTWHLNPWFSLPGVGFD